MVRGKLTHSVPATVLQEENEVTEFFVTLEKDPQQEDFLQGRMPGNPYSSNEPGIGPLMRDIKNKICQDCDLVALLEDDSGMEVRMPECGFLARRCEDAVSRQLMIARMVMQRELVLDFLFSPFQLLVNNKIISLDLPVAEVYKKVWCPTNEVCVTFINVNSTKRLSLIVTEKWEGNKNHTSQDLFSGI